MVGRRSISFISAPILTPWRSTLGVAAGCAAGGAAGAGGGAGGAAGAGAGAGSGAGDGGGALAPWVIAFRALVFSRSARFFSSNALAWALIA